MRTFEFECIRSNRKTIGIQITSEGKVVVRAPHKVTEKVILECVEKREDWIIRKLELVQEKIISNPPVRYTEGEFFMFLGEKYPLMFKNDESHKSCKVYLEADFLIYENGIRTEEAIKNHIEKWYRFVAQEMVEDRIQYYMKYFNVKPSYIKVKVQKKRWGSCSSKRHLLFNYNLIKAPIEVLDYIVVHEMSHMVHMNHSDRFWDKVSSVMPNYKRHAEWLKENGHLINKS